MELSKSALIGLVLLLVVAACVPQQQPSVQQPAAQPSQPSVQQPAAQPSQPVAAAPQQPAIDPLIKELLEKHRSVTSLHYVLDDGTPSAVIVWLKGDKLKKEIFRTRLGLETYYELVYVDRAAKTAYTHCAAAAGCAAEHRDKAIPLNFAAENAVLTPFDLLKDVTSAEKIGTERFDERSTIIIQFTNEDGHREQLLVDSFFGVPLQQRIYGDDDEVLEKHTFTKVAFNSLKEADVTLPGQYRLE